MGDERRGARRLAMEDLFQDGSETAEDGQGGRVVGEFDLVISDYAKRVTIGMLGFEQALNLAVEKGDRKVLEQMREVCAEGFARAEEVLAEAEAEAQQGGEKSLDSDPN
jgi:hypothetical protein